MANTGLDFGPFALKRVTINSEVRRTSPGAYALTRSDESETFYVNYVGRDDKDVNDRLKDHVDNYARFKFSYFSSPEDAYKKECKMYHDFTPYDNKIHPAKPEGNDLNCPVCGN